MREASIDAFRADVKRLIAEHVTPLVPAAEASRTFPREAVLALGGAGVFRARWEGGEHGDPARSIALAEELGYAGAAGVAVGVSVHAEAVLAMLRRHGRNPYLEPFTEAALDGSMLGCVAVSEHESGSDMAGTDTVAAPHADGLRVTGRKWFVSPGDAADFCLVLSRPSGERTGGLAPRLNVVLVPRNGYVVERRLETVGVRSLATCRIAIDTVVPESAVLGRPGAGLAVISWGLLHERLAGAGLVLGLAALALDLAVTRMRRRTQFGVSLERHQALRLRVARLVAEVDITRRGVQALAADLEHSRSALRATAAAKVTASALAERVISETMHIFGGLGYVEDESPFGRLWRDVKFGRIGGGSDEMMLELVAGGLVADEHMYDQLLSNDA